MREEYETEHAVQTETCAVVVFHWNVDLFTCNVYAENILSRLPLPYQGSDWITWRWSSCAVRIHLEGGTPAVDHVKYVSSDRIAPASQYINAISSDRLQCIMVTHTTSTKINSWRALYLAEMLTSPKSLGRYIMYT